MVYSRLNWFFSQSILDGFTKPKLTLGWFLLRLIFLYGTPPFITNLFRLASLLALLVEPNLSFLISALAWFIKITKVALFESVEIFCKDSFLVPYFSLFPSMIFLLLCLLPSAVVFMMTTWPFDPLPPQSLQQWRLHKKLWSDWSAGLRTGVFF